MLSVKANISLPRAVCPEQVGISSEAVMKALRRLEEINYEYHSFMVVRGGVVAAECYRYPFRQDMTHCMYSVSKNVTATALGFAVSEGKISLETKLSDIFPDKYPHKKDEYFEQTTIRNLISMTSGKSPSPLLNKAKGDWYRHFSEAARNAKPGERFQYVNECSYLVSACLRRVLGMGINDYLVPRLWNPLGIDKPFWETDRNGVEAGGWGLQMRLEDMAKLAICYHNGGVFSGKQIIPRDWVEQAKLNQTPAGIGLEPNKEDGYGFSVWRKNENHWKFDGMYGQTAAVYEKEDLICLINSGEINPNQSFEIFDEIAATGCIEPQTKKCKRCEELDAFLAERAIDAFEPSRIRPALEEDISGKVLHFGYHALLNAAGFPLSILPPTAIYMSKDRAGNLNDITFDFCENGCNFSWSEGDERNTVFCKMDGGCAESPITLAQIPFVACCAAKWLDNNTIEVCIRPMQSIAKRILVFTFSGGKVTMDASVSPSMAMIINSIVGSVGESFKNPKLRSTVEKTIRKLDKVMEPESTGRVKAEGKC